MSYQPSQNPVDPDVRNEIEEQELLNSQQQAAQSQPAHNKRRIYPQQSFDYAQASPSPDVGYAGPGYANANPVYDPAAAQAAAPVVPQAGYPNPPEPGYYTPATPQYGYPGAGTDGLNKQMSNVTLGPGYTASHPPANRTQDQRFPPAPQIPHMAPLNELYNIDLLQELPPPIADLSLPPPPINLPPSASVSMSPEVNCPLPYMRCTLNAVPHTASLLKKSKLPFAVVVQPFAALKDDEAPIPVIADNIVSRCRRCRTYINPFVTFIDQGNRWRCCMCNLTNDVPAGFDWNHQAQKQEDRWTRKELNYGAFEFIAPPEYMVRPPEPLTYLFLIDVSVSAVNSGLLATTARTILESLDRIPNEDQRTRLGFICVDSSLHYLSIPLPGSPSTEPSMLVVGDLDEPFLPQPQSLLVSLSESRQGIETLLERLNNMFANNLNSNNAMGPALRAAHKLIAHCGGRILCFMASLPNTGIGKLDIREDKKMLGTNKETNLLNTANSFYKSFAVECSKSQVSVDMFLFSSHYQDVASLSCLPRYTAGQTFFYPGWNAGRTEDAVKYAHELSEHLSQEVGLEGVLRVRATSGLRMATFYGNFFNRSSDLCAFPSIPRDQSYVIDISFDETMTKPFIALQTAVLYTSCNSERRIRVLTLALPTTNSLADVYSSADQKALMAYYTHKTIEKALSNGLEEARKHVTNKLVELLKVYRKELMATNLGSSAPLQFCANLRMLPLLSLALIKHIAIRKSAKISSDMRSAAMCLLTTLPVKYLIQYLHADMYSLHDMPDEAGLPDADSGAIVMPPKMNLTGENIQRYGLYLIDDGQTQFLYIGRDAVPQLIEDVFGLPSLEHVVGGKTTLPVLENDFNLRVNAVIAKSRERMGSVYWPNLYVVREDGDPALKLWASTFLIQDRTDQAVSYVQYLTLLREQVSA